MYTVEQLQTDLARLNLYSGRVDGIYGTKTNEAVIKFQKLNGLPENGKISDKLISLINIKTQSDRVAIPRPVTANQWPVETTESLIKYFGQPGANQVFCTPAYPLRLAWDTDKTIRYFSCNAKVKDAFEFIFEETLKIYGIDQIKALGLDLFGGCLNVRKIRGGNRYSTHSWGIAIDLNPANNVLTADHKTALFAKPEYDKFWNIVESTGAMSLGRRFDYDWMHFQFCRR